MAKLNIRSTSDLSAACARNFLATNPRRLMMTIAVLAGKFVDLNLPRKVQLQMVRAILALSNKTDVVVSLDEGNNVRQDRSLDLKLCILFQAIGRCFIQMEGEDQRPSMQSLLNAALNFGPDISMREILQSLQKT